MNIMSIPIPHLCVVTAADIEFKAVVSRLSERDYSQTDELKQCRGRVGRNFVTVLQSEIGAHGFKEKLAAHLGIVKYDALFIIGLAGALSPELKTGEVIFYDTCFVFRPEFGGEVELPKIDQSSVCDFQVSSSLRQLLMEEGLQCMFGAGLTLDFMVTTPEEKLAMGESYGAAAVDMESHDVIAVGTQFGLPVIALRVIVSMRQEAIFLSMPDALDLLVVCVEAGLGLDAAMRRVNEELTDTAVELCQEITACNMQLQMGRARRDVLHDLGVRTGVDDVKTLVAILIQAEKFGSSIANALRVQSDSMRIKRRQMAEEQAQKTGVKIIFPLVLFIFPGIFVVLVGPAAIMVVRQMLNDGG